jgi:hypothetical protein
VSALAQYKLPFLDESAHLTAEDQPAGEAPKSYSQIVRKSRLATLPAEQSSKIRNMGRQRRRKGTAKASATTTIAPDTKLLVSRKVAAEMLSISVRGVDYMTAAKRLTTRKIANRVLIPIEEIRRFARFDHPERMAS